MKKKSSTNSYPICSAQEGSSFIDPTTGDIYEIHPSIGIARVGNSPTPQSFYNNPEKGTESFYIAPKKINDLPTEFCLFEDDSTPHVKKVEKFKDKAGQIKRQAAHFIIYKNGKALDLKKGCGITSINWKVHLANKKAAWRQFSNLDGDTLIDPDNTYEKRNVPWRNEEVGLRDREGSLLCSADRKTERQKLIIDPGARQISVHKKQNEYEISPKVQNFNFTHYEENDTNQYLYQSFPSSFTETGKITSLGSIFSYTGKDLYVLGGSGKSGGTNPILSSDGADTWHDDISDGPLEAQVLLDSKISFTLKAWVVVASPKYVPELANITTLDDVIFDMAVRHKEGFAEFFDTRTSQFKLGKEGYYPDFQTEIFPIFQRMKGYQWVTNVAPMVEFASPPFDIKDERKNNKPNREKWFKLIRPPVDLEKPITDEDIELNASHKQLFVNEYNSFPLMPLGAGDNAESNSYVSKFVSLTATQYYYLYQWKEGYFRKNKASNNKTPLPAPVVNEFDRGGVANCVGYPMSPGIEVTWTMRNPILYEDKDPYRIKHARKIDEYNNIGLTPDRDETLEGGGCEPGDLTKRMSVPWQADFFQCGVQNINFSDLDVNSSDGQSLLPAYFSYWWPAQSPWNVYTSNYTAQAQSLDGDTPSGAQVRYQRGINSYDDMITHWKYVGFVKNISHDSEFHNFVEVERNLEKYKSGKMSVDSEGRVQTTQIAETVSNRIVQQAPYPLSIIYKDD